MLYTFFINVDVGKPAHMADLVGKDIPSGTAADDDPVGIGASKGFLVKIYDFRRTIDEIYFHAVRLVFIIENSQADRPFRQAISTPVWNDLTPEIGSVR